MIKNKYPYCVRHGTPVEDCDCPDDVKNGEKILKCKICSGDLIDPHSCSQNRKTFYLKKIKLNRPPKLKWEISDIKLKNYSDKTIIFKSGDWINPYGNFTKKAN